MSEKSNNESLDSATETLKLARYLIRCALIESMRGYKNEQFAFTVMALAHEIAVDILADERGMRQHRARQLVNEQMRMMENMTERMAKEAGFG